MSCNGCRVLRKGCSENCVLRPCLQWIQTPESQAHATVFVAKFFGRAGLMSFISAVPDNQRQSLFQSLLFEAAGRTVNPVNGAVGLLWTGNWHVCQASVETVLQGGTLRPITELLNGHPATMPELSGDPSETNVNMFPLQDSSFTNSRSRLTKRHRSYELQEDLDLNLNQSFQKGSSEKQRVGSPSMNSDESSVTTTCLDAVFGDFERNQRRRGVGEVQILNLFN